MRKSESEVRSLRPSGRRIAFLVPVLAIACCAFLLLLVSSGWWREQRLMREARPMQAQLETYRQEHRQYPESLAQIGIAEKEEGPIHYQRETEDSYILWFGMQLGESKTFHSQDGKWH